MNETTAEIMLKIYIPLAPIKAGLKHKNIQAAKKTKPIGMYDLNGIVLLIDKTNGMSRRLTAAILAVSP